MVSNGGLPKTGLMAVKDVWSDVTIVPEVGGVYLWYGHARDVLGDKVMVLDAPLFPITAEQGLDLLYVGSSWNLRGRLWDHLRDNSMASSFRMSMGTLLIERLGLRVTSYQSCSKFGFGDTEHRLTKWLCDNTFVRLLPCENYKAVEKALILGLPCPINITNRRAQKDAQRLMELRRKVSGRSPGRTRAA